MMLHSVEKIGINTTSNSCMVFIVSIGMELFAGVGVTLSASPGQWKPNMSTSLVIVADDSGKLADRCPKMLLKFAVCLRVTCNCSLDELTTRRIRQPQAALIGVACSRHETRDLEHDIQRHWVAIRNWGGYKVLQVPH